MTWGKPVPSYLQKTSRPVAVGISTTDGCYRANGQLLCTANSFTQQGDRTPSISEANTPPLVPLLQYRLHRHHHPSDAMYRKVLIGPSLNTTDSIAQRQSTETTTHCLITHFRDSKLLLSISTLDIRMIYNQRIQSYYYYSHYYYYFTVCSKFDLCVSLGYDGKCIYCVAIKTHRKEHASVIKFDFARRGMISHIKIKKQYERLLLSDPYAIFYATNTTEYRQRHTHTTANQPTKRDVLN